MFSFILNTLLNQTSFTQTVRDKYTLHCNPSTVQSTLKDYFGTNFHPRFTRITENLPTFGTWKLLISDPANSTENITSLAEIKVYQCSFLWLFKKDQLSPESLSTLVSVTVMDEIMASQEESVKSFSVPWHFGNTASAPKLFILSNLKKVDGWPEMSIYIKAQASRRPWQMDPHVEQRRYELMDGEMNGRIDEWRAGEKQTGMINGQKMDAVVFHITKNTWRSEPLRRQQHLFRDIGSSSQL